jgi:Ala-tRNA(Pro) deacylase
MVDDKIDIEAFLRRNGIPFEGVEHPAVYTYEEAERLVPTLPGAHTKNLFLRDRKGKRHFLVVVGGEDAVDLDGLARLVSEPKLGLASAGRLQRFLGVEPGAVSLLGLVCDKEKQVEILIDAGVWAVGALHCHPLTNTATFSLPRAGLERFFEVLGYEPRIVEVPVRLRAGDDPSRMKG